MYLMLIEVEEEAVATVKCQACTEKGVAAASSSSNKCDQCDSGRYQHLNLPTEYHCKFCQEGKEFISIVKECSV